MKKDTLTKKSIPESFTLSLALVDAVPVILFCISFIIIATIFKSPLFLIGVLICTLSGLLKVLFKFIIAIFKKNVFFLNRQLRVLMPIGFVLIIIALIVDRALINFGAIFEALLGFPSVIFFSLCIIGMLCMSIFPFVFDSSKGKSNWIEQLTNSFAQACLLVGILFIVL